MTIDSPIITGSIQSPLNLTGNISASGAITGSGFFTTGNIVANTLIVQTVSSSISYITGSTKFGTLSTNTHQFTGSLFVTGGLNITTGSVGIGIINPTFPLEVSSTSTTLLARFTSNQTNAAIRIVNSSGGFGRTYSIGSGDTGSVAGNNFYIYDETGGATRFVISGSGNIGIGTTSPTGNLHINANSGLLTQDLLIVQGGGSPTGNYGFMCKANNGDKIFYTDHLTYNVFAGLAGGRMAVGTGSLNSSVSNLQVKSDAGAQAVSAIGRTSDGISQYMFMNAANSSIYGFMQGSSDGGGRITMVSNSSGGVYLASGGTSWTAVSSDVRKKKNFETVPGLTEVLQIEPIKYHFNWEEDTKTKRLGFKAQNIQPLIPEMVSTTGEKAEDGSDYLTVTPDYILPVLVKAIQELNQKFEDYKSTHP